MPSMAVGDDTRMATVSVVSPAIRGGSGRLMVSTVSVSKAISDRRLVIIGVNPCGR